MSLSNHNRQLSVAPMAPDMAHLERRGRGSLGGGGSPGRLSHSFPECSHFFGLLPQLHPGQSFGAGSGVAAPEGSYRIGSTSFSRLLQPSFCGDESLRVLAAGNRPFLIKSQGVKDTIQDGDYPVHSVVSPQRGLDGLHRPQRRISPGSNPPGFQEVSEIHGLQQGLPIQGPLLRPVHGSAGLHPGHGSGFDYFTYSRHPSSAVSGRLADSGVLPRAGSPVFEGSTSTLQLSGDCRQLGKVTGGSDTRICYLGVLLDSISFRASPAQKRVDKLLSIGDVFLSSVEQPAKSLLELLGVLSSLTQLFPGGQLRMRSFQFLLHRHWDRRDPDALVRWSP